MLRADLPLAAAVVLSGCSYEYPVEAVFQDGRVTFIQRDDDKTVALWCMKDFKVARIDGTVMWEFDADEAYRTAKTCRPFFPMRYGEAPAGAKVVVAPRRLTPGQTYIITGYARGMLSGVFRYDAAVQHRLTSYGRDTSEARKANDAYWSTQRMDAAVEATNDTANKSQ